LPNVVGKTKEKFIVQSFESHDTCVMSFDLWMSKRGANKFVFIVHFLNHNWEPYHVTIGLFEIIILDTYGAAMALQVNCKYIG
jgi:hypothetical protein